MRNDERQTDRKPGRKAEGSGAQRGIAIATIALFGGVLFICGILFWILPDKEKSEQENRMLQGLPEWTPKRFFDGDFGNEMNAYYADQFPARDFLVGVKGSTEFLLGKGENNGVLLGKNGQLAPHLFTAYMQDGTVVQDTDSFDPDTVLAGCDAVLRLRTSLAEKGIPLTVLLPPRTIDVAASAFSFPTEGSDALHDAVYGHLTGEGVIDMTAFFRQKYDAGEYVYYRTDHHWTTRGAYYAYLSLMESFGMSEQVLPADDFSVRQVPGFYGTAWSRAGFKFVESDTLELWMRGNESEFVVRDEKTGQSFSGFYNLELLEQKDKYAAFFDGTHGVLTVTKTGGEKRERLLIVKDSFANSVMPFLAQHFDLVVLNLSGSGDETRVSRYCEEYQCDRVLLLYNVENVVSSPRLSRVK